ncbi:MAG: ATP-binding cassette domain-containing protein [Salibacteraceae bacterium]
MKTNLTPIQRFFRLLKADRKDITRIFTFAALAGGINLTLPLGVQAIINYLSGGIVSTSWVILVILVIAGLMLAGIMQVMQLSLIETIQERIFQRSAFEFAIRIPRIQLEQVTSKYAPELINRFFDTLSLQKGLSKFMLDIGTSSLQIVFGIILLSFYHPSFILFGLALVLVLYLVIRITGPRGLRTSIDESTYKYQVAFWLEELARTMNTFKLAGNSSLPVERTDNLVTNYLSSRKDHFKVLMTQYLSIVGFKGLVAGGLLVIGSLLVLDGQINLGQFVAAEIIIIMIINSSEKLILAIEPVYDVLTALEKIALVTDLDLEREDGVPFHKPKEGPISLSLRNLKYGTGMLNQPLVDGITLDIEAGERVLVHGYSGSGRTKLLELISGLYQGYQGSIVYDDQPASSLNLRSLRCQIGDSLSEEEIFEGTIEENILLGKEWLTKEDMIWACKRIGLYDYIKKLHHGFQTPLTPKGSGLPEHIVRKIKMVRSIVEKPALVIWQESLHVFSEVDKQQIMECMIAREQPWTLVVNSGSKRLARQCDNIVLLEDGKMIFHGTYSELETHQELIDLFYE